MKISCVEIKQLGMEHWNITEKYVAMNFFQGLEQQIAN